MNDAEILYNNVKNICREQGILIGKVETDAGVCAGYLERLKHQKHAVKVSSVRKFARALGVPMLVLMEGMLNGSVEKAQPEIKSNRITDDCIGRQEAIDALARAAREKFNLSDEFNHYLAGLMDGENAIRQLPSVQPEVLAHGEGELIAQPEQRWIPVTERMPENDNEVLITVWDAEDDYVEVYKGFYQGHEWWTQWCHGCSKIKDEPCGENIVIAWIPLPEPYR